MSDKHGKNRENTFPLNIIQHVPPLFAFRSEKSSHLDLCVYSGKRSLLEALWGNPFCGVGWQQSPDTRGKSLLLVK